MAAQEEHYQTVNRQRRAGVLLHPTSLPGSLDSGDIGHQAYRFIEFLSSTGFKVWQMLPLGPTHSDRSPYQCLSSHAGNPHLISLDWLNDKGWLDFSKVTVEINNEHYREQCLQYASNIFYQQADSHWHDKLDAFKKQHAHWLDDFTLFMALKKEYQNKPWYEWPNELRHREQTKIDEARSSLRGSIRKIVFEQFVFFNQWHEVREYAKQHQVELFGDMPIFVARDSADVWAYRENFLMDMDGEMEFIAGVPPDAFSDTGQRWGNPLYDWNYMQETNFSWWKQRFATQLELFDLIRIDHFRGLQACWQIPQHDDTAINGNWVEVPGQQMLEVLFQSFHHLPLVAEDLGVITEPVIELKDKFNLAGMKVLQFAFDGNNKNPHLPHCHRDGDVVYTGTHDNDTTLGWAMDSNNYDKPFFADYTALESCNAQGMLEEMLRLAFASVSFLCVIPMQDILRLGTEARMNRPGIVGGNWLWRFQWQQLLPTHLQRISQMMKLYQR